MSKLLSFRTFFNDLVWSFLIQMCISFTLFFFIIKKKCIY